MMIKTEIQYCFQFLAIGQKKPFRNQDSETMI